MAKFIFVAVLALAAAIAVTAAPAAEEYEVLTLVERAEEFTGDGTQDPEEHLRYRRVTCDLLTYGGVVGDSACAANCLSMGKAGGRCNDGVCQCRKTKIKDLWDKRFG